MIEIFQHIGMGDYIICNGLIRNLISNNKKYLLLSEKTYECSIKFMYKDVKNISFKFLDFNKIWDEIWNSETINFTTKESIIIGVKYLKKFINTDYRFDEIFYKQFDIPFSYRWSNFRVDRNLEREYKLFSSLNLKENGYIFLHETPQYKINNLLTKSTFPIFRPDPCYTNNIFDYGYILENAGEIHCIDSSFKNLIDTLQPKTKNLYYHYNRQSNPFYYSSNKLDWKKISYSI